MLLLRDILQPGKVEEGAALYATGSAPSSDAGPRYHLEKRGGESWAVLDHHQGDTLVVLTEYKKGAQVLPCLVCRCVQSCAPPSRRRRWDHRIIGVVCRGKTCSERVRIDALISEDLRRSNMAG